MNMNITLVLVVHANVMFWTDVIQSFNVKWLDLL